MPKATQPPVAAVPSETIASPLPAASDPQESAALLETAPHKTPEPTIDDNMDEIFYFTQDHLLIMHRERNEPRRLYEETRKMDPKERTGKYRQIVIGNLLKECSKFSFYLCAIVLFWN